VRAQTGLWLTLAGASVATVGGVVDLVWVLRKRTLDDAIDDDDATSGGTGQAAPSGAAPSEGPS
jgi:hypothetical protein